MGKLKQTILVSVLVAAVAAGAFSASAHAQCGELTFLEAIQEALNANQALAASGHTLDAQEKEVAIKRAAMLASAHRRRARGSSAAARPSVRVRASFRRRPRRQPGF